MALTIPENDHGRVYMFLLPEAPGQDIAKALGMDRLDLAHVDVFRVEDLQGLGLRGYLTTGMGIAGSEIGPEANRDAGQIALVRSAGFEGRAATVEPAPGVRHLATYHEAQSSAPVRDITSSAPDGVTAGKPPASEAKIQGRVAMIALIVILVLTAIMVWIA